MLDIVYLLTCITLVVLPLFIPLSIMRQNSYRIIESAKVIKSRVERVVVPIFITVICAIMERSLPFASCLILVAYSIGCLFYYIIRRKSKRKITVKTFRLVVCYFLLCIPVCAIVCIYERAFYLPLITFVVLCLSKILLLPYEKRNELKFEKRAKEKLKKIKPKIIAVTGSYGKTTFKNVLSHLLACKYKVCVSPKSYNTPQGVCITINNHLKDDDEILILEMGARYKGDIKRLVNMVQPKYCVLTSIGNQHLATFKIEERLIKEKISIFDLVATYNFYNADCDLIPKTVPATACGRNGKYSYSNTIKTENGWVFDFNYKGKIESITCPIYADYIPQTLCLAFAVALELGVTIDELKKRAKTLKEVAHRQQLLYNGKDVIIDDAYNSNESGFISAVNLLATFPQKKIIITPGVVELGKSQFVINEKLARYANSRIDEILCYGVNAKALKKGGGEKVKTFSSLKACMNYYETIKGDKAVLFENDLPDCY